MRNLSQYPYEVRPLTEEEGGGFLISFPDFSECVSDGETPEEALQNGMDALRETIAALESMDLAVPEPKSVSNITASQFSANLKTPLQAPL